MSAVAIIPARCGSQRIPGKNIKNFHGVPIIAYSINAAIDSGLFSDVVVSTDSDEIGKVVELYGATVHRRSEEMARNEVGTQEVARHVLDDIFSGKSFCGSNYKYACVIYPCAPMIEVSALRGAFDSLIVSGADYVVPVATWLRDPGQWYWGRSEAFMKGVPLIGQGTSLYPIDPRTECDINTPEDWDKALRMYEEWKK